MLADVLNVAVSGETDCDEMLSRITAAAREAVGADGATIVFRDGSHCYYADESAISPLWKGRRFPMSACISGWVMQNKLPAVIPDIYLDVRIPTDAYRATFVQSLAMVPVGRGAPVAAIGTYWATRHEATAHDIEALKALADAVGQALGDDAFYSKLRTHIVPAGS